MTVYLVCYAISFFLARQHLYVLSGLVLVGAALWLYIRDYLESQNLIHLRGLFCLAFVGGQGISCLKLSRLQTDWSWFTWLCFLAAVVSFWLVYEYAARKWDLRGERPRRKSRGEAAQLQKRVLKAMAVITGLSAAAFVFEALWLGFIPMFSYGVPHAYSYFHVTGVHYFTVSCVLTPSLLVVYLCLESGRPGKGQLAAIGLTIVSLCIPLLCVSRFQLILAVGMAAFTFISMRRGFPLLYGVILVVCMIPAYLLLTVLRSHSVEYLNGIFEMKNQNMPIFITQPYMYIANNYDNFNCLVEQLGSHSFGLRMLFPLWAFTGLKFLVPALVSFPLYVTKEELTTVTLFYDAYYDFGILGMVFLGGILGVACAWLSRLRDKTRNPVIHVVYAQIAMYMALAFFTTWFSNPATWFYLAVTAAVYLYVGGLD